MFVLTNFLLRMKFTEEDFKLEEFHQLIFSDKQEQALLDHNQHDTKIQKRAFIFCMLLPPFVFIPLIVIFRSNQMYMTGFIIALVGIESTTVLLLFLLEVK